MVLLIRVEVITVNAHRVDMPGLAVVRGRHAAFLGAVHGSGVLEVEVGVAEGDGHVLPRVAAQGAAGVFVAFVAGVDVSWVDCFFWPVSFPLLFSSFGECWLTVRLSRDFLSVNRNRLANLVVLVVDGNCGGQRGSTLYGE